jgi:hypothetical protein
MMLQLYAAQCGCRTYNGYDINWRDAWKNALLEVANTGKLEHTVLKSPRQKDGRGNISPVTIILPTLAMECKLELGKKLSNEDVLAEMIEQFKASENREPNEAELKEIRLFVENR